jgi:predicted branched-subunit amino acid permease
MSSGRLPLPELIRDPDFLQGVREMSAVAPGIAAWGLVTGIAMVKSGLSVPLAVVMSLVVFSGSAQLAALPLIAAHAPLWLILATAFCVNLRFVIFSAAWRPYFGHMPLLQRMRHGFFTADLNYVMFMRRYPEKRPSPEQGRYFWGGVALNWSSWQVPSIIGIVLGDRIPAHWGVGFAGTLALLGLMCSLLTGPATVAAAAVAGCAAVAAYALPLKLNIVVAIAAAVAVGVLIDHASTKPPSAKPGVA